jgi:hypothetical protein
MRVERFQVPYLKDQIIFENKLLFKRQQNFMLILLYKEAHTETSFDNEIFTLKMQE